MFCRGRIGRMVFAKLGPLLLLEPLLSASLIAPIEKNKALEPQELQKDGKHLLEKPTHDSGIRNPMSAIPEKRYRKR